MWHVLASQFPDGNIYTCMVTWLLVGITACLVQISSVNSSDNNQLYLYIRHLKSKRVTRHCSLSWTNVPGLVTQNVLSYLRIAAKPAECSIFMDWCSNLFYQPFLCLWHSPCTTEMSASVIIDQFVIIGYMRWQAIQCLEHQRGILELHMVSDGQPV